MTAASLDDLPEIPLVAEGDPHAILKEIRAVAPLARTSIGVILALRHRHLELITSDATRQMETETKVMQGVVSGPIFDLIDTGMLFANGDAHRRRRAPIA